MKSTRKGLGRGKGKGYTNIIRTDPVVHSNSAKGRKTYSNPVARRMEKKKVRNKYGRLKKFKHVVINARRWFDKTYGNTYHSVEVNVDGKFVGREPFTYGYGTQYNDTAHKILQKAGYYAKTDERLKSGMQEDYYLYRQDQMDNRDNFVIIVTDVQRKRDL